MANLINKNNDAQLKVCWNRQSKVVQSMFLGEVSEYEIRATVGWWIRHDYSEKNNIVFILRKKKWNGKKWNTAHRSVNLNFFAFLDYLFNLSFRTHCWVCWPVRNECFWTRHAGNRGCPSSVDQGYASAILLLQLHVICVPLCFWPVLCLCAFSWLCNCPATVVWFSKQSGWRKESDLCWVGLKLSNWRSLDQSRKWQSTTMASASFIKT